VEIASSLIGAKSDAWMKIRDLTLKTVLAIVFEKPFYRHLRVCEVSQKVLLIS
jgi:hypothetical protein